LKAPNLNYVCIRVETIDGSATEGEDYHKVDEILTFQPDETEKEVNLFLVLLWTSSRILVH
jgi:hypothetical protein